VPAAEISATTIKIPPAALKDAKAAGIYGGTGFAGLLVLLPEGYLKSILFVFVPTLTLIVSSSWHLLASEIATRVADWKIRKERKRVEMLVNNLNVDPTASPDLKAKAQKNLDALVLLQVEISARRVKAIIDTK
jgi:hypothetical protein